MLTMQEIQNMTDDQIAAENKRMAKLLLKRYALQLAATITLTVATIKIINKLDDNIEAED